MIKPDSCRAAIVAALPGLAANPERFQVWADKGRVVSRRTASLAFEWRYRLNLLLESYTGSPDSIMVPLLLWLRDAQPDIFLNYEKGDSAIVFEAHILDLKTWDVLVQFEVVEAVTVTRLDGGDWDIAHLPEPNPDDLLIDGAGAVPLREIWHEGQKLLPRGA